MTGMRRGRLKRRISPYIERHSEYEIGVSLHQLSAQATIQTQTSYQEIVENLRTPQVCGNYKLLPVNDKCYHKYLPIMKVVSVDRIEII